MKMLGKIENSVIADSLMESPEDRPNVQTTRKPASRPMKASTDTPLQARRSLNQVIFVVRNFMFLTLGRKSCVVDFKHILVCTKLHNAVAYSRAVSFMLLELILTK